MKVKSIMAYIMCAVILSVFPLMFTACNTKTYTISAVVTSNFGEDGQGGTITPEGSIKVDKGGSQKYVISADDGFYIASIIVNSVELEKGSYETNYYEYTVQNVQKDTEILVKFDYKIVNLKFILVEDGKETWVNLQGQTTQATSPQQVKSHLQLPEISGKTVEWRWGELTGDVVTTESFVRNASGVVCVYGIVTKG